MAKKKGFGLGAGLLLAGVALVAMKKKDNPVIPPVNPELMNPEQNEITPPVGTKATERMAMVAGTEHFSLSEFNCHDGTVVPEKYRGNVQLVMQQLEVIRVAAGNKVVTIHSGYRSKTYNKKVGGKPGSFHLSGMAADIEIKGMKPAQVKALIEQLIAAKKIISGGVGLYKTFVHYDIGPAGRRWNG